MSQEERARPAPAPDTFVLEDRPPALLTVDDTTTPARLRWARLRFAIVGPLLASPPEPGELTDRIAELAQGIRCTDPVLFNVVRRP